MTQVIGLTHTGLGRTDDGQFLPRVLPGETVEVGADGVPRILSPSPDRVSPPCRHYKACGGCAMQHASDGFVEGWKAGIVARALSAHGIEAQIEGVDTSPPRSRRRAKLSGRRTKKGALVGFHARASDLLIEVPDCQLLTPALMVAIPALERLTALVGSRKGEVALTVTESLGGLDEHLDFSTKDLTPELRISLADFARQVGFARLVWGDEPIVTMTPPQQQFGKARVVPPPGSFLQATRAGEAALVSAVRRIVGTAGKVVDLFAGCGTFALPLAEGAQVHAVEGEAAMMQALDAGWRASSGLKQVTTETRDLFRRPLLSDELAKFDAVVIDPPRAGAEAQVAEIIGSGVPVVAMVSCNPVTFARDAQPLVSGGYGLNWVRVVDQFRWSSHVEVVAAFTRL